MSEPIVTHELSPRLYMKRRCEYSYDQLLELFHDDGNLVKPLVMRCIKYEEALADQDRCTGRLRAENQRLRDLLVEWLKDEDGGMDCHQYVQLVDTTRKEVGG